MAVTRPGTPNFSRRKSMRRYCRLWPPPRYRAVMWPLLFRPPVPRSGSTSERSGSVFVISEKSETERKRVAGVIGLNCRVPISALEHRDRIAFLERYDRLFPGRPPAREAAIGAALGADHQRADIRDSDLEQRLDRRLDLRLGGLGQHAERILLARRVRRRRLLVDERVHHKQRALARPRVERRLLRELAHLLRDPQAVAAGLRAEHDAAVPPVRRAGRPLPRAAGPLLAPWLLVAAGDEASRLGR